MDPGPDSAARSFERFSRRVLAPAVYPTSAPLSVAAFQSVDPLPYAEALRARYRPVAPGWRWGPAWSTAWFRLTGRVPRVMAGRPVALRFSSGTEALLWDQGVPRQGFDANRDTALLLTAARGGERLRLHVEAACNHAFGAGGLPGGEAELARRWRDPAPGRLERCELVVVDWEVWRLWRTYEFARQLMGLFRPDSRRGRELRDGLRRAGAYLGRRGLAAGAAGAGALLGAAIRGGQTGARARCLAVGQAHIDTAWLWPIRETKRKCLRTFASVLELMARHPGLHFLCSQAQHYAWVEQESPALFARIAARVRQGRWEPAGAMWVEADCNLPAGESLVRQILHGTRYWQEKFGARGRQRLLYLPDSFGFPACLPQIMAQAGLDTFVTSKLWWNDTNEFPYASFRWRGLDGTQVLAHCTPGGDYNLTNTPAELMRGRRSAARKPPGGAGPWLQPFGFGDGGGGPTDWMIHNAALARNCRGLPGVVLSSADAFCDQLARQRDRLRSVGRDLPLWDGELYLECHRGTYTTQGRLKRDNRRAEQELRIAEWLTFAGPTSPRRAAARRAAQRLDQAWKLLLLNQFHDTLAGSASTAVYLEAAAQLARVRRTCRCLIRSATRRWSARAKAAGLRRPMVVFNPCTTPRGGVVRCQGRLYYVPHVPALGAAVVERTDKAGPHPARVEGRTLSNGIIAATIDRAGRIVSLRRFGCARDACAAGADRSVRPLNQLVLYEDRPRQWDAWNIEAGYQDKALPVTAPAASWRVVAEGPLRAAIEVSRPLGRRSRLRQRFVLEAGARRLDIHTRLSWHEDHLLLRALFPVNVRRGRATCETQFGHVERPTQRRTARQRAMFEVCAQRWADLSEPGFGLALLNDCKYGHSCHRNVIGLSLLRSPTWPDPRADRGNHRFTYSLMIHAGDWRAAGVDREAEALNAPLFARALGAAAPGRATGATWRGWAPFKLAVQGSAAVMVAALKPAEDRQRLILRLVETHGGAGRLTIDWNLPVGAVEPVDLLERPRRLAGFAHDGSARRTRVRLRGFQIVSLAAE